MWFCMSFVGIFILILNPKNADVARYDVGFRLFRFGRLLFCWLYPVIVIIAGSMSMRSSQNSATRVVTIILVCSCFLPSIISIIHYSIRNH